MITFITPYKEEKELYNFKKSIKEGVGGNVIGVFGGEGGADGFFDAWRRALPKVRTKHVCLTHSDTEYVHIPDLEKHLKGDTGLVGVAGSTVLHKDQPWWFSAERAGGGILSGQILHEVEGENQLSVFGPYGEVVVLDGVCMIAETKTLKKVGIPDVTWTKWDFYDHILSHRFREKGYKIKTIPIEMVHQSRGGNKRDGFVEIMTRFADEYLDKTWRVKQN